MGTRAPQPGPADAQAGRATLDDVAALAGVAIATVDRVLNERGGVQPATARRVLAAARQLRLRRVLPSSYRRGLRIEVLLNRPELPLIARMNQVFGHLAGTLDRSVIVQRSMLANDKPAHLARRLRASKADAVIVYAPEHADIVAAIDALAGAEVAVVTVISDLPGSSRLAYAGIDHHAAGRTAGFFMARKAHRGGPVLVLCHDLAIQSHAERVRGLVDSLGAGGLTVAEIIEGGDESHRSARLLHAALQRRPDVVGIYNVGAANDAVRAALRRAALARPPVFVGHELTADTIAMLRDGTMTLAIDQNPERQARHALDILLAHFGYIVQPPPASGVAFTLHGPYNTGP